MDVSVEVRMCVCVCFALVPSAMINHDRGEDAVERVCVCANRCCQASSLVGAGGGGKGRMCGARARQGAVAQSFCNGVP